MSKARSLLIYWRSCSKNKLTSKTIFLFLSVFQFLKICSQPGGQSHPGIKRETHRLQKVLRENLLQKDLKKEDENKGNVPLYFLC